MLSHNSPVARQITKSLRCRPIAGGAKGCSSTPNLSEKSEIFRLSEILG